MRQINPIAKAAANAEKALHRQDMGRAYGLRKKKQAEAYLAGTHRYERTFSDQGTGELRTMKGADAKALNDELFKDFLAAVGADVEGRSLERWKVVERDVA